MKAWRDSKILTGLCTSFENSIVFDVQHQELCGLYDFFWKASGPFGPMRFIVGLRVLFHSQVRVLQNNVEGFLLAASLKS